MNKYLQRCEYDFKDCKKQIYFDDFTDLSYGSCYRFNNGKNSPILTVTNSGIRNGLSFDFIVKDRFDVNAILLVIHNSSVYTNSISDEAFRISPGIRNSRYSFLKINFILN